MSFDLSPGEVLGIVGESGSGKSTMLFAAMRYLADNGDVPQGSIRLGNRDMLSLDREALDQVRGKRIAMVFQDPTSALNPSMRIGDQIAEGVLRHTSLGTDEARAMALDWMERVQLEDPQSAFRKYPHELSGGQRQRVMIALALALEPDVLLMDEPTTALDVVVQAHILKLVRKLAVEEQLALVFVTHDLGAVAEVADRILVLYAGEAMEVGTTSEVLRSPSHPYTRGLLAALPKLTRKEPTVAIPGSITVDPGRFNACIFSERCPHADKKCRTERPALTSDGQRPVSRCHFPPFEPVQTGPDAVRPNEAASSVQPTLLELSSVSLRYRLKAQGLSALNPWASRHFEAVRDVSFTLPRKGSLAIVGESGSGKSTIARAILGLMPVAEGTLTYDGTSLSDFTASQMRQYRRKVQIVFQHPTSSLNPRKRIIEQVARPVWLSGRSREEGIESAGRMLASVGLDGSFHDRMPSALSGGQLQRVAIARAFVTEPELLLLDEPTTALDVSVQAGILELLAELKEQQGCTFLLISHDLAVVRQIAQDVLVLKRGNVCEAGDVDQVFEEPQHEYTRALLGAALEV